ncbi:MAG: AAA family ATPase [Candidatus Nealsonbacteria bacterium]|nr:AAA family ATPase [Candidatus Nealsonbacteria bacterium]
MFNFDLKKAKIYQAVKWSGTFDLFKKLRKLFLVLSFTFILLFVYGFFEDVFIKKILQLLLGSFFISLPLTVIFWTKELFFEEKLKNPKIKDTLEEAIISPSEFNLAEFLSFEAASAVAKSINFAKLKKIPELDSSILGYFILKDNPNLNFIFSRLLLNLKDVKKLFKAHLKVLKKENINGFYSDDFQRTILKSLEVAMEKENSKVQIGDILTALSEHSSILKKILINLKIKKEDIESLTSWLESLEKKNKKIKNILDWQNLAKKGSIARDWACGYSVTLDNFSINISSRTKFSNFSERSGHKKEIKAVERILARAEKNNVLLVGETGVGRKSIAWALAELSAQGKCLPEVNYKRVIELDMATLLARTQNLEETEIILDRVFKEVVSTGNIILVIDDFHNYIGKEAKPGVVDIAGIISKYLNLTNFPVIAIVTPEGLHNCLEQNTAILSLFEKVEVFQISKKEALRIIEDLSLILEKKYKKFISYLALKDIIDFCDKYMGDVPFPKKAIDLLNEAMVEVALEKGKIILPEHVARLFSEKTEIPVGEIETKEKETLLNLEELIHQRIINQEEAVSEVSAALRRARVDITIRKGPMGAFLFLGPTGVGKTETVKALAEVYFGSAQRMIRLDMSEFQALDDIKRLLGQRGEEGFLTTRVRENPFSLILLDEFEKAHSDILNLFLQVFDEGFLTDGMGRKVYFQNTIIIATSNAGYSVILDAFKNKTPFSKVKTLLLDFIFQNKIFRPELVNRFDAVVIFKPLSRENLIAIAELLLLKLKENLKRKEIDFVITPDLKEKIVDMGYNPIFGAREMKRVIQDKIENKFAEAILKEEVKRGYSVKINPDNFEILINE